MESITQAKIKGIKHYSYFTVENNKEMDDYICERFGIQDHYLVGRINEVKNGSLEAAFFFIEDLVNPFTSQKIGQLLEGIRLKPSAFCPGKLKKLGLRDKQLVLFQFKVDIQSSENLSRGKVLIVKKETLQPIEDNYDLLNKLNITDSELKIPGVINHSRGDNIKFGFFNDYYKDVIQDKLDNEIDKIRKEEEEMEKKQREISKEINAKKELLEQIKEQEKEVQNLHMTVLKEKESLKKTNEEIYQMNERLREIGFSVIDEEVKTLPNNLSLEIPEEEKELVKGIQQQVASAGLYYDESTIRRLYTALKTNQFIILNGPSGTGKTSLISAFAELVSADCKIIPVQPSWIDKQDVLGFYNPMRKQYVPSVFLDSLKEAEKNPDKLFLICLDELNLAQIEYYLADILSVRELKKPVLDLYSRYEYDQAMEEINWYVQNIFHREMDANGEWTKNALEIKTAEHITYIQRHKNLTRYPNDFAIPKNVRLIGTMNVDGTVRPLSPKVIDRSFIIEILKQTEKAKIPAEIGQYELSVTHFEINEKKEYPESIKKELQIYKNLLTGLNADYNNRVENHLVLYSAAAEPFCLTSKVLGDELLAMKILPRVHFLMDDTSVRDYLFKMVKDKYGEDSLSYKKLKKMISASNKTKIFSYWS